MAMLAEPRQRKRYNLMPKGKALYEDESRFGTKMLEKMGWKKGEGLGASSEGSKDFVRIRYKNDACGFGFEHRDDQWTQHEQNFNGLLKTLNNEETDVSRNKESKDVHDYEEEVPTRVGFGFQDASATEETKSDSKKLKEKISGISLEERSKQSKARVHYKKFTKGKDLVQYSEKDLANIFGKKAVDEEQANDFYKNLSNSFGVIAEEARSDQINETVNGLDTDSAESATKKKDKENKKNQNNDSANANETADEKQTIKVQTFTSSMSVQDYFKMKMEAIKNKKADLTTSTKECDINNPGHDEPTTELNKKKKKNKKEVQDLKDNCLQEPAEEKSKKSEQNHDQEILSENEIKKQTKAIEKKKRTVQENGECDIINSGIDEPTTELKKKKKKNKKEVQDLTDNCLQQPAEEKSKKSEQNHDQEILSENEIKKQTKAIEKKKRTVQEIGECDIINSGNDELTTELKKKKKKNKKEVQDLTDNCLQQPAKKKSKKSEKNHDQEILSENEIKKQTKAIEKKKRTAQEIGEITLEEEEFAKIKSKKSKNKPDQEILSENEVQVTGEKKSKKDKNKIAQKNFSESENEKESQTLKKIKKSKKRDTGESVEFQLEETGEKELKKNKKIADDAILFENGEESKVAEIILSETKTKNKKDKSKNKIEADLLNETTATKKRKIEEPELGSAVTGNLSNAETDLVQESDGKYKNELNEVIEIIDSDKDEPSNAEIQRIIKKKKKKSKKSKEPIEEISDYVETSSDVEMSKKEVSSSAKDIAKCDANLQVIDLEELKKTYQAFNDYSISSFCAEKFRNISLTNFNGSSLPQIVGYGLTSDLQLNVQVYKHDEENIAKLWKNVLEKNEQVSRPRKTYRKYIRENIRARKAPKLHVKSWQRRNAFQLI